MSGENNAATDGVAGEAEDLAQFDEGFDAPADKQAPAAAPATPAQEPAATASPPPAEPAAAEPPPPEYMQITKAQFESLMGAATKVDGLERQLSTAFGSIGNFKQRLDQMQQAAPSAGPVMPDLSELKEDFPELAGLMEKAFSKGKPVAAAQPVAIQPDPQAIEAAAERVVDIRTVRELEELHPGWRTTVGPEGSDTEFRRWVSTLPPARQQLINATRSTAVIDRFLRDFGDHQEARQRQQQTPPIRPPAQQQPAAIRRDRFRGAVQPRGEGGTPTPKQMTANDELEAGFTSD